MISLEVFVDLFAITCLDCTIIYMYMPSSGTRSLCLVLGEFNHFLILIYFQYHLVTIDVRNNCVQEAKSYHSCLRGLFHRGMNIFRSRLGHFSSYF